MSTSNINSSKINYDFIDSLRFISMFGIVMEHSSFFFGAKFNTLNEKIVQIFSLQVFKFGTIIFFLLAGFLIGDKFTKYSTKEYLQRRIKNTLKPWLFWVIILLITNYLDIIVKNLKYGDNPFLTISIPNVLLSIENIVFNTSFWFIPNFLICIAILLLFRKYLYSIKLGAALLLLSLFYSVNLYIDVIPTSHTTALFGFIFYLWLGVQINKYYDQFKFIAGKTSMSLIFILLIISFSLASLESYYLLKLLPADPFNTLRITNIIYSLLSFVFLYKLGAKIQIKRFNPSILTFGIYLVHQILIFRLMPLIFRPLHINFENRSAYYFLAIQLLTFAVVYTGSILIVYLINKSKRARWIVGR
ncbi:acyltransferase family protein [Pedobacter sp. 22163]|uniref:acyltransferase family protein n=1 Tax=Pedobacter sp. 22163 TaxID=3453883 RepID=UPI003F85B0C8